MENTIKDQENQKAPKHINRIIFILSVVVVVWILFGEDIVEFRNRMSNQFSKNQIESLKEDSPVEVDIKEVPAKEVKLENRDLPEQNISPPKAKKPRKSRVAIKPDKRIVKTVKNSNKRYSPKVEEFNKVNKLVLRREKFTASQEAYYETANDAVDELVTDLKTTRERLHQLSSHNYSDNALSESSISVDDQNMDQYDNLIWVISRKHDVDPLHLKTLCAIESNFNTKALNPNSTATGLTQLIAPTYRSLIPKDSQLSVSQIRKKLQNPYVNMDAAATYLKKRIYPVSNTERQVFFQWYLGDKALELLVSNPKALESKYMKAYHPKAIEFASKAIKVLDELRTKTGISKSIYPNSTASTSID